MIFQPNPNLRLATFYSHALFLCLFFDFTTTGLPRNNEARCWRSNTWIIMDQWFDLWEKNEEPAGDDRFFVLAGKFPDEL